MPASRGRPPRQPVKVEDLPNRLREHRLAKGWSLETLADKTGQRSQTVARHETIHGQMSLLQMERYAALLGVRPEEILATSDRVPERLKALVEFASQLSDAELDRLLRLGRALTADDSAAA